MSIFGRISSNAALRALAISCALTATMIAEAQAMRVSPMVSELSTSGTNSSARIEVQNVGKGLLAFETQITRIEYDSDGKQIEVPADADFLVFPPQGTLAPGGRQVVRVQWLGGTALRTSQSYYLSVNQLPVAFTPETAGTGAQVQIVYHMKALITVAPPGSSPKVEVVSAQAGLIKPKAAPGADPKAALPPKVPGLVVRVRNTGTRYAMMAGANWIVDGKDKNGQPLHVVLDKGQLGALIGTGYLGPVQGDRTFEFATDQPFAEGPIKVRFGQ
jgi:fimbrial chaperone protein